MLDRLENTIGDGLPGCLVGGLGIYNQLLLERTGIEMTNDPATSAEECIEVIRRYSTGTARRTPLGYRVDGDNVKPPIVPAR